jgi:hypothetical protein
MFFKCMAKTRPELSPPVLSAKNYAFKRIQEVTELLMVLLVYILERLTWTQRPLRHIFY